MADNAWVSLLQKAPSYAEQQAGVASGLGAYGGLQQALAGAAGTNAITTGTEIGNKQKMALNMAIKNSSSYDPSTGVRTFDPEKFTDAISQSEYGADALAKYPDILKIYQDNALQNMSSATQNPDGSPNTQAQAEYVKAHPLAAASLTSQGYANRQQPIAAAKGRAQSISEVNAITGQNYQEAQPGSIAAQNSQAIADPVAEAKARAAQMENGSQPEGTQMTPGTGESTITGSVPPPNPFSLTGTVDVRPMDAEATTIPFHYDPKLLSGGALKSAQASARANGVQLTSGTPEAAAAALDVVAHNKFEEARAAASKPVYKDGQLDALTTRANIAAFNKSAPALQNQIYAGLTTQGQGVRSTDLSQTGAGQGIENTGRTMAVAKDFNDRGFSGVTPANTVDAQRLQGDVKAIHSSAEQAKALASKPKEVAALSDDDFGLEVFNIMKGVKNADDINTISADAHLSSYIRPGASLGKVLSESSGPVDFVKGAFRSNLSKTDRIPLLQSIQRASENAEMHGIARSKMEGAYGSGKMPWEIKGSITEKNNQAINQAGGSQDSPITITNKNTPLVSGKWYQFNGVTRRAP